MNEWHRMPPDKAAATLGSDPVRGLSPEEAAKRRRQEGKNRLFPIEEEPLTPWRLFLRRPVFLPLLLLVAGVALLLGEQVAEGYVILFSLLFHLVLTYAANARALSVMAQAEKAALPAVKVIRNGRLYVTPGEELVRGDVILLQKEDYVPADCLILAGACRVLEKGITPREEATKSAEAPFPRQNAALWEDDRALLAGTVLVSGEVRALVTRTGQNTYLASVRKKKKEAGLDDTPLLKKIRKLSLVLTVSLLAAVFALTLVSLIPGLPVKFPDGWTLASAFAAGTLAELYPILACITAGNAVYGALAPDHRTTGGATVRRSASLFTLASVDRVILPVSFLRVEGSFRARGLVLPGGDTYSLPADPALFPGQEDLSLPRAARLVLRSAALAAGSSALWADSAIGTWGTKEAGEADASCPERVRRALAALAPYAMSASSAQAEGRTKEKNYRLLAGGLTEEGVLYGWITDGKRIFLTVTAKAELLLPLCSYAMTDGVSPLTEERRAALSCAPLSVPEPCEAWAVAVAVPDLAALKQAVAAGQALDTLKTCQALFSFLSQPLVLEGILLLGDALTPGIGDALAEAQKAGVALTLTADSPCDIQTAACLGLAAEAEEEQEKTDTDDKLPALLTGLSRADRGRLIAACQAAGETVAYLGGRDFGEIALMRSADVAASQGRTLTAGACIALSDMPLTERREALSQGDVFASFAAFQATDTPEDNPDTPGSAKNPAFSEEEESFWRDFFGEEEPNGGAKEKAPDAAKRKRVVRKKALPTLPDSLCDAVRMSADLVVAPSSEGGRGGFGALAGALFRARAFFNNLRDLFCYLAFAASLQGVLLLVTFFSGLTLATPVTLTLTGLVLHPMAAAVLVLRRPARGLSFAAAREKELFSAMPLFALWGALAGGFTALFAALGSASGQAAFAMLAVLAMTLVLLTLLVGRGHHTAIAYLALLVLTGGGMIACAIWGRLSWVALLLLLGLCLLMLPLWPLYTRRIRRLAALDQRAPAVPEKATQGKQDGAPEEAPEEAHEEAPGEAPEEAPEEVKAEAKEEAKDETAAE